jgi:hypothetical protein
MVALLQGFSGKGAAFEIIAFFHNNSGKQRKNSRRLAVFARVEPAENPDFRQERQLGRCSFGGKTAKNSGNPDSHRDTSRLNLCTLRSALDH